jgi:glycosyltransferase involved in cell wall biosynthesis
MRSKRHAGAVALALLVVAVAIASAAGIFRSSNTSAAGTQSGVDSIKVHGAWILEIRAHGQTVRRVQFHNDLSNPDALVKFLTRQKSVGQWEIGIGNQICGTPASPEYCWNDEGGGGSVAQTHTVVVTTPTSGPDAGKIVLKGSFNVGVDGTINLVHTALRQCSPSVAPSVSCSGDDFGLTSRSLASGVPVVAGQQVLETVKISFS